MYTFKPNKPLTNMSLLFMCPVTWKVFHSLTGKWRCSCLTIPSQDTCLLQRWEQRNRSGRVGLVTEELQFDSVTTMIGILLIDTLSPGGELIFNWLML